MIYIVTNINGLQGENTVVKRRTGVAKWQESSDIEKGHTQDPGHHVLGPRDLHVYGYVT